MVADPIVSRLVFTRIDFATGSVVARKQYFEVFSLLHKYTLDVFRHDVCTIYGACRLFVMSRNTGESGGETM